MVTSAAQIRVLAAASGVCGLSYEILYARLIAAHFGATIHVVMAVIGAFLLGVAMGSLFAPRLARHIALVEASVGVYALVCVGFVLSGGTFAGVEALIIATDGLPAWSSIPLAIGLVAVPAFLIGAGLPLFAYWIEHYSPDGGANSFGWAFAMYNLGAAVFIILVELFLAPELGVVPVMAGAAVLNLVVAGVLYFRFGGSRPQAFAVPMPRFDGAARIILGVGLAEGLFLAWGLTLATALFPGNTQIMASVIGASLIGMPIGTWVVTRWQWSLHGLILASVMVAALTALCLALYVDFWNVTIHWVYEGVEANIAWALLIPALMVVLLPMTVMFGGVEPLVVEALGDEGMARSGEVMFWSGIGSSVSFLGGYLFLPGLIGPEGLFLLMASVLAGTLVLDAPDAPASTPSAVAGETV